MNALTNPFKSGYTEWHGQPVSERTLLWHHLAPARKIMYLIKPIDLEIAETVKDGHPVWFWKVDLPDIMATLNRLRNQAIEDEAGFTWPSAIAILRGLEGQKAANESSGLPFIEEHELVSAQERVDRYMFLENNVPSVQDALMDQFGNPNNLNPRLSLEAANEAWEYSPMALQPELLYNAEANADRSENVSRIEYDAADSILTVTFTSGSMYRYFNVPADVARGFKSARSKGSYLHNNIKLGGYKYERFG